MRKNISRRSAKYQTANTKAISQYPNKHLSEIAPHHGGGETVDIDMEQRNYITVILCTSIAY